MYLRSTVLVKVVVAFCLIAFGAGFAYAEEEKLQVLSQNKAYHTKGAEKDIKYYEVSPFSPLQFNVTGPGKLILSLVKTYTVAEGKKALDKASFQIYKDGALLATIEHGAEKNPGVIFAETTEFLPGKEKNWSVEVAENETWTIGVLVTPNKGAVGITFEVPEPEPEEEPLALVPLVPLVPIEPQPAAAEPATEPVAATAEKAAEQKVAEPAKAAVVEPEATKEEKKNSELPPPVDEMVIKDEPQPVEKTEEIKPEPSGEKAPVVSIEPRLGVNLAIQSRKINNATSTYTDPMFTAGLAVKYVIPVWSERLRIGLGFDYSSYKYSYLNLNNDTDIHVDLLSLPVQAEVDVFILTKGIFRPFVGMGGGISYVRMKHTTNTFEMVTGDNNAEVKNIIDFRIVETKKITYAVSFWAGCQFFVWHGGPFVKMRYMLSMVDYDDPVENGEDPNTPKTQLLTNADHGGLSFLAGYQFEF